jgi:Pyruvate/2-oxoacid:ferredoxin oxidoreductase delta subunit
MAKTRKLVKLEVSVAAAAAGFGSASVPTPAHHRIVRHYSSPLLFGPPPSGDLLELVMHMFTAEEAELVQHLPPLRPRAAEKVALLAHRGVDEIRPILDHLAFDKAVVLAAGKAPRRYTILPVVPGTFEMALMTPDLSTRNSWHREFAEIFERVFEAGYLADYVRSVPATLRVLPANQLAGALHGAWPAEKLEELLEPHKRFALGNCQCRVAMQLAGRGCDRPLMNCAAFGPMANPVIVRGLMQSVSKQTLLDAKREAEKSGCVTWIGNAAQDWRGNASCSCCGCCCHALRLIAEFNVPGLICRPHFLPVEDGTKCQTCRLCSTACPTGARQLAADKQSVRFEEKRCIGCGLCVVACPHGALRLEPVRKVRQPEPSFAAIVLRNAPAYLATSVRVWAGRLFRLR